jgi:cytochrome bd-type quinol oxidase subunit 1
MKYAFYDRQHIARHLWFWLIVSSSQVNEGPNVVRSHLSMDVHVTINVPNNQFVFSIYILIFCFSILFLTSKYLIIYCITKDDISLLYELDDIST